MPASRHLINAPLNTLHVSTATSWRGGENQLWLLAKGLIARGHQATIAAPKGAPLLERAAEAGISGHGLTLRGAVDPAGSFRLARLVRALKPDILHLHDSRGSIPGKIAAWASRNPHLCILAHRRTAFDLKGAWKYGGRVDRVIAISQAVKAKLLAAGVDESKIAVVFSGLAFPAPLPRDHTDALALRAELGLSEGDVLIAHAAALTSEKRQSDLISALAHMANPGDAKAASAARVHLAIAGTGELDSALKLHARQAGVEARVHLMGFRRDLAPLWAAADMACFCSEAEGLCTALIEAQAAGLPAVVTRAGGMVEVVAEGTTGFQVDIGSVEQLAEALGKLVVNREMRETMGRAAGERARATFSDGRMVDATIQVYRDVRAAKSGRPGDVSEQAL